MNEIITKDVNFYGDMLQATQDLDGKVWVGVSSVCKGIGLTVDQYKNQKKKIAKDLVLSRGMAQRTFMSNEKEKTCLQLEYLPLWLAKINITPTMKKEMPEVADKLIRYQLRAKDVLTDAFFKKNSSVQSIELKMPDQIDYFPYLNMLERKIDNLNQQLSNQHQIISMLQNVSDRLSKIEKTTSITIPQMREQKTKTYVDWQRKIYEILDLIIFKRAGFKNRTQALSYIYGYMTRTYGIVWDQEIKEFKEKSKNVTYASKIEVIYAKGQLRSIFEAVLADLSANPGESKPVESASELTLQEIIEPLVNKNKCNIKHPGAVYRLVYTHMGVDWDQYPGKKKEIIRDTPELKGKFESTVKQLMERSEKH